jgi:hypothetical protein
MANPNEKPSTAYVVKGAVAPQSVAAAGTATSGWVDVGPNKWAKVVSCLGAGAGTAAVKLEQATSSGGAGAKDLITAANLGITAQANSTQVQADGNIDANLDLAGGFRWIRVSLTVTGGAGTLACASLELGPAQYQA